ncbi:hypothetical protein E2C01_022247 [Portunus trituberculatus]|uniref:Uncharacterized protein n=1 Tax=Portunus trituberculatus TaxID=210409 RepID=A0A5B7E4X4_PORTR|nr:hypothetical protein [Portunus trituberculatus]
MTQHLTQSPRVRQPARYRWGRSVAESPPRPSDSQAPQDQDAHRRSPGMGNGGVSLVAEIWQRRPQWTPGPAKPALQATFPRGIGGHTPAGPFRASVGLPGTRPSRQTGQGGKSGCRFTQTCVRHDNTVFLDLRVFRRNTCSEVTAKDGLLVRILCITDIIKHKIRVRESRLFFGIRRVDGVKESRGVRLEGRPATAVWEGK